MDGEGIEMRRRKPSVGRLYWEVPRLLLPGREDPCRFSQEDLGLALGLWMVRGDR